MVSNKKSLRQIFVQQRSNLEKELAEEMTTQMGAHLKDLLSKTSVHVLHVFLPIKSKSEVDTYALMDILKASNYALRFVVPRVVHGTKEMQNYVLDDKTVLKDNQWGIPEPIPQSSESVSPFQIDAVLIPLLAFDVRGFRVGYGGGFYDRFLAQCRPDALKIGLSFFDPVEKIEDVDEYDVPMDYCVTPGRVWSW